MKFSGAVEGSVENFHKWKESAAKLGERQVASHSTVVEFIP